MSSPARCDVRPAYKEIWALDFEFTSRPEARPVPVCLVARELISNRLIRLWQDELGSTPPFPTDESVLFVAFFSSAEWGCFAALGWPMPARVLDLYVEFRAKTNGIPLPTGRSLLSALSYHGIRSITSDVKHAGRALVMCGGPWSIDERRQILEYCQTDVDCLGPLLERMVVGIRSSRQGFGQALLRGRYMVAVARMEHTGVPIDVSTLHRLRAGWGGIKSDLVRQIDKDFGVYEGTTFKAGLFVAWLADRRIPWPRTSTGRLQLDQDTFRDLSKGHPELMPLKELRHALSEMRLEELAVGEDGRNRALLGPFGTKTGRNTPSNTRFIFGPSVWLRGLIKPAASRALAYIDWSSQEIAIAAVLSGDGALLEAVQSGDPYLTFAIRASLAPEEATKRTHGAIRDVAKICLLGTNYGMQAPSLADRTGLSVIEAQDLLRRLARTFPIYTEWAQHVIDVGLLTGRLSTVFGWPLHVIDDAVRPTTLRNYPMQANGAEMLRLASCLTTEAGVEVCAPVHDALLVEGPAGELEDVIASTRAAMAAASASVLGGFEIGTDANVVRYPERYADPRGTVMWVRVMDLLNVREVEDIEVIG